MTYVLVHERFDYADEFDVHSAYVRDEEVLKKQLAEIEQYLSNPNTDECIECGFGTNESIIIEDITDVTYSLTIKPVSEAFAKEFQEVVRCVGPCILDSILDQVIDNTK